MPDVRVLLLRHGEVASHRGDVPVTEPGLAHAERTGAAIGAGTDASVSVLYGGTRRTRETAEAIARGIGDPGRVLGPIDAFALRNPDLYLSGARVNMVSSAEHLAEQVPGLSVEQVEADAWWPTFFTSPDRIGWWLGQDDPPGETGADLAVRVRRFARSFTTPGPHEGRLIVCVTHSPVLRSVLRSASGEDPGEPAYVTGALLEVGPDGRVDVTPHDPLSS